MRIIVFAIVAVIVALGGFGCASSPWRDFYSSSGLKGIAIEKTDKVEIRIVSPEQIRAADSQGVAYLERNSLAPEDVSPREALELRRLILAELRVRDDPSLVTMLGVSNFTASFPADARDANLVAHAKSIGADFVVVATEYLGEQAGYTAVPVWTASAGTAAATAFGSTGWAKVNASSQSSSVSSVVVPTTSPRWASIALYWRRLSAEERARVDRMNFKN